MASTAQRIQGDDLKSKDKFPDIKKQGKIWDENHPEQALLKEDIHKVEKSTSTEDKFEIFKQSPLANQEAFIDFLINDCFVNFGNSHIEYRIFYCNHTTHFIGSAAALQDAFGLWTSTKEKENLKSFAKFYESRLERPGQINIDILEQLKCQNHKVLNQLNNTDTTVLVKDEYATILKYLNALEGNIGNADWKVKKNTMNVLQEFVPWFSHLISGAAFHGLIELGWRLESGFSIAPALAYIFSRGLDLGCPSPIDKLNKEQAVDPIFLLNKISNDGRIDTVLRDCNKFMHRMKAMAESGILDEYDIYIDPNANHEALQTICENINVLLFKLFVQSSKKGDFFILHTITGLHALRYVIGHIKNKSERVYILRNFWRGLMAAYCAVDRPVINEDEEIEECTWKESLELAEKCPHIDLHWYKLFHVAVHTEKRNPNLSPLVRQAVKLYYTVAKKY